MVDAGARVTKAIVFGLVIFLVSALIEGLISLWLFKRYGGCPMLRRQKEKAHS
jgi:hypothetical protein